MNMERNLKMFQAMMINKLKVKMIKKKFKMQIIKLEIMISILIKIIKNKFYTTTKEGNELILF